jgi:glyoxylate/hydroxypyruvate reductase
MSILFFSESDAANPWRETFARELPGLPFRVWPDCGPVEDVRYALVWKPPPGFFVQFPNLKAVLTLGAGVDPIPRDPRFPEGVRLLRLIDAGFAEQMAEYALYGVLRYQRRIVEYESLHARSHWEQLEPRFARELTVGVLGLGVIGRRVAERIAACGYPTAAWTRTARRTDAMEVFSAAAGLRPFLQRSRVVINVLPLTPETENLLNAEAFAAMPRGGFVINMGRGAHIVDADLLAALDSGQLEGAMLDVFRDEPLPASHPFWHHPGILVTPHVAAPTIASEVQSQIVENIKRMERGEAPLGAVDLKKGY